MKWQWKLVIKEKRRMFVFFLETNLNFDMFSHRDLLKPTICISISMSHAILGLYHDNGSKSLWSRVVLRR